MNRFWAVIDKINRIVSFIGLQPIPKDQLRVALWIDRVVLILLFVGILVFAAYVATMALTG